MTFEELLKNEIETQYGSIYHFSQVTKISQSTFTKISKSGVKAVTDQTLRRIAFHLALDFDALKNSEIKFAEYTEEEKAKFSAEKLAPVSSDPLNPIEADILNHLKGLDVSGQFKVLEYIKDITPKYGKE